MWRLAFLIFGVVLVTACNDRGSDSSQSETAITNMVLVPTSGSTRNPTPPSFINDKLTQDRLIPPPLSPEDQLLADALQSLQAGHPEAALEKANTAIQDNPQNVSGYSIRGHIYTEMNLPDKAEQDYNSILRLDDQNSSAKFNLSELKFQQKEYDEARSGFYGLENDRDFGDLAAYKVFLCDLFSGHDGVAQSELEVFNKAGSNPSYYFGNAAWCLYHKNPEAEGWLKSGLRIYAPEKVYRYTYSLKERGYLPLPTP